VIQKKSNTTFGEWLRIRRRELNLTQQELADQTGCARITLRRLESGTLKPSNELAELLLKELGISASKISQWILFARGQGDYPVHNQSIIKTNLPSLLTSFIGREKEMVEVVDALSKYRLVTLTGSGGAGKTRLSLQVAARLHHAFPDGIWFIELATISNPALIPQTILNSIGLLDNNNLKLLESLQDFLRSRKMLLILDNCEHLIDACANLVADLLSHSNELKILTSSREALGVQGEYAWRIPSLTFPNAKKDISTEHLPQYGAVKLFIERAELSDPSFRVDKNNAPGIAQICSRLDGIPLAIELAASRLRSMSVDQIQARLDDRFNLLTNGVRTVLPRHQTLRAAIDWSYNLLSDDEKTLFRRLAVFIGGFSLDGAESVCSGDEVKKDDILDLLTSLVNKSLINTEKFSGEVRYRRLETIRQYAREKFLETDNVEKLRKRHIQFYVELTERSEPELRGSNQTKWFKRLEAEMNNLRSALEWTIEWDRESFLRLSSSLWMFFRTSKYKHEGIEWLSKAIEVNKDVKTKQVSTAIARLSYLCLYISGNQKQAEVYAKSALELAKSLNDDVATALALISLSEIEWEHVDKEHGKRHTEQALGIAREMNDHWLISVALIQKSKFDQLTNPLESRMVLEESLKKAQLTGDKRLLCSGLLWLIVHLVATRDYSRAKEFAQQRVLVAAEIDDKDALIFSHNILGNISILEEDYLSAEEHAETVINLAKSHSHDLGLWHGFGIASVVNLALMNFSRVIELTNEMEGLILGKGKHFNADIGYYLYLRAWVYILEGDIEGTEKIAKELLIISKPNFTILLYIECLRIFASLEYIRGNFKKYTTLTGAVTKLREKVAIPYFDYPFMVKFREDQTNGSRAALGESAFQKALEKGSTMNAEEAIKYAQESQIK